LLSFPDNCTRNQKDAQNSGTAQVTRARAHPEADHQAVFYSPRFAEVKNCGLVPWACAHPYPASEDNAAVDFEMKS
jgi:hypothetical protein